MATIKEQAAVIRDETATGKNTATRVGTILTDIATALEDESTARASALATETAAREGGDKALRTDIDANYKILADVVGTTCPKETSERKAADAALQTALATETAAREGGDKALRTDIDANYKVLVTVNQQRKDGDAALQTAVDSVNATLADSGGLTLMECVASSACTITVNGTVHSVSARKPYRYTFPAGTAAITSFALSDAAKSYLRVFRLTGRKVKVSGSSLSLYNCTALRRADLSALDTSERTSLASLFNHCPLEKAEGLSHFDTSKVTNMTTLFQDCQIKEIDLSTWDTSACTNLATLFCQCAKLADTGYISQWDTSKVTTVAQMFYGCAALESLDLSGWDLSACTELTNIFYGCTALKSLQLGAGWGKMHGTPTLDLSPLTAWKDGVSTLLTLYNRAIGGLGKMTIKLTASAYASLQEMGGVTYLNQSGYTVTK